MLQFNTTIYARPGSAQRNGEFTFAQQVWPTLTFDRSALGCPFSITFEEAAEQLSDLDRMDLEPDGYFVVSGTNLTGKRWQLDGHLYDRNERLLMVNLKGTCPTPFFEAILAAIDYPKTPVMFELTSEAVYLEQTEFVRYAALNYQQHAGSEGL